MHSLPFIVGPVFCWNIFRLFLAFLSLLWNNRMFGFFLPKLNCRLVEATLCWKEAVWFWCSEWREFYVEGWLIGRCSDPMLNHSHDIYRSWWQVLLAQMLTYSWLLVFSRLERLNDNGTHVAPWVWHVRLPLFFPLFINLVNTEWTL